MSRFKNREVSNVNAPIVNVDVYAGLLCDDTVEPRYNEVGYNKILL